MTIQEALQTILGGMDAKETEVAAREKDFIEAIKAYMEAHDTLRGQLVWFSNALGTYRKEEDDAARRMKEELPNWVHSDVIGRLAARYHAGWMKVQQQLGYADHAFPEGQGLAIWCPREDCGKHLRWHHPLMRPWAELGEGEKKRATQTVRLVLEALEQEDAE